MCITIVKVVIICLNGGRGWPGGAVECDWTERAFVRLGIRR
jgi:hypothetical protein